CGWRCRASRQPPTLRPNPRRRITDDMSDSLRDQLLGLGFKAAPKPARTEKPSRKPRPDRPARPGERRGKRPPAGGGRREDIDLAKAYAIRAQKEKDERIAAERVKQETARLRREARARLAKLLEGKVLNA